MSAFVSVSMSTKKAQALVESASDSVAAAVAEQMMNDSRPIVPKQEGIMRDSGHIEKTGDGARELVWNAPYAGYQWFGVRADGSGTVHEYTTPGTSKQWVDVAKGKRGKVWDKVAQNALNKELKK